MDCLDWATNTCLQLGLKFYEVEIEGFGFLTGTELAAFTEKDFCRKIGHLHGPQFYKVFAKLLRKRTTNQINYDSDSCAFQERASPDRRCTDPDSHVESLTQLNLDDSNDSAPSAPHSWKPQVWPHLMASPPTNDYSYSEYYNARYSSPNYYSGEAFYQQHPSADGATYFHPLPAEGAKAFHPDSADGASSEEKIYHDFDSVATCHQAPPVVHHPHQHHHQIKGRQKEGDAYYYEDSSPSTTQWEQSSPPCASSSEPSPASLSIQDENKEKKWKQKIKNKNRPKRVRDPFVWEFLLMLLQDSDFNPSHIKWEDERRGIFKLVQKEEVAREWGERTEKHKQAPLTYGHFSRSLRYHYTSGYLLPVSEKHLVYKFGPRVMELCFNGVQN